MEQQCYYYSSDDKIFFWLCTWKYRWPMAIADDLNLQNIVEGKTAVLTWIRIECETDNRPRDATK